MPISDLSELKQIAPLLDLAKILGKIGAQLVESPIQSISVECYGDIEDSKPISHSYLIGLLQNMTDTRLNFVNAAVIAQERGISFSHILFPLFPINRLSSNITTFNCSSITINFN